MLISTSPETCRTQGEEASQGAQLLLGHSLAIRASAALSLSLPKVPVLVGGRARLNPDVSNPTLSAFPLCPYVADRLPWARDKTDIPQNKKTPSLESERSLRIAQARPPTAASPPSPTASPTPRPYCLTLPVAPALLPCLLFPGSWNA